MATISKKEMQKNRTQREMEALTLAEEVRHRKTAAEALRVAKETEQRLSGKLRMFRPDSRTIVIATKPYIEQFKQETISNSNNYEHGEIREN